MRELVAQVEHAPQGTIVLRVGARAVRLRRRRRAKTARFRTVGGHGRAAVDRIVVAAQIVVGVVEASDRLGVDAQERPRRGRRWTQRARRRRLRGRRVQALAIGAERAVQTRALVVGRYGQVERAYAEVLAHGRAVRVVARIAYRLTA